MKLLLATNNRGKLDELRQLLADVKVEVVPVGAVLPGWQVPEEGHTFEDNAVVKAKAAAQASSMWALADDSGLEVDALDGAPGVHSARYAADDPSAAGNSSDEANNRKLMAALAGVGHRAARYRCVLALCSPEGVVVTTAGVCSGRIVDDPRGSGGFGYDPYFEPDERPGRTMAELDPDDKNRISHRGRALAAMRACLLEMIGSRRGETR